MTITNKKLIVLGIIAVVLYIAWKNNNPSYADCLRLESNFARAACIQKYHPTYNQVQNAPVDFPISHLEIVDHEIEYQAPIGGVNKTIPFLKVSIRNNEPQNANNIKVRVVSSKDKAGKQVLDTSEVVLNGVAYSNTTTSLSNIVYTPDKSWYSVSLVSAQVAQ